MYCRESEGNVKVNIHINLNLVGLPFYNIKRRKYTFTTYIIELGNILMDLFQFCHKQQPPPQKKSLSVWTKYTC